MRRFVALLLVLSTLGMPGTSSLLVLCATPGPDGHVRIETVGSDCCIEETACAPENRPDSHPVACAGAHGGGCGDCLDTPLVPPSVLAKGRDGTADRFEYAFLYVETSSGDHQAFPDRPTVPLPPTERPAAPPAFLDAASLLL